MLSVVTDACMSQVRGCRGLRQLFQLEVTLKWYRAMGPQRIGVAQAQFGSARPGSARCDTVTRKPFWAWLSLAQPVVGLPGSAQSSLAWASHGSARFRLARLGSAQHSMARLGAVLLRSSLVLAGSG